MSEVFNSSVLDAINRATTYSSDYIDPSTLKVIVIDGETRHMTIPDGENLFGARGDKNVERKYFQCPKIVGDNIDLSQHLIYVSYVFTDIDSTTNLPETNIGMYHCEDVAVEGDNITFSWLLSGNVLHNPGFIAFKVCAKEKESDPTTVFNTTPAIGIVLYTIPDGSEIIPEEYPDIITQLLADMDATKEEVAAQIAKIDAIKDQIEGAVEGTLINDNTESNIFTYSSQKINTELRKKATYYDSVASMKADNSLKDGSVVVTLGYYSENDGGGATYLIRAKQSYDEDDGGSIHELNGGQLVAELIIEEYVTPGMFGAKGDGVHDDTEAVQQALNVGGVIILSKIYKIYKNLAIKDNSILIGGGKILGSNTTGLVLYLSIKGKNIQVKTINFEYCELRFIDTCDSVLISNCVFQNFGMAIGCSMVIPCLSNIVIDNNILKNQIHCSSMEISKYKYFSCIGFLLVEVLQNIIISNNIISKTNSFGIEFYNSEIFLRKAYNVVVFNNLIEYTAFYRDISDEYSGCGGIYNNSFYTGISVLYNTIQYINEVGIEGVYDKIVGNFIKETGYYSKDKFISDNAGIYGASKIISDNIIENPGSNGCVHYYSANNNQHSNMVISGNQLRITYKNWESLKHYNIGDFVIISDYVYKCVKNGVSSQSIPMPTENKQNIQDGSCEWAFHKNLCEYAFRFTNFGGIIISNNTLEGFFGFIYNASSFNLTIESNKFNEVTNCFFTSYFSEYVEHISVGSEYLLFSQNYIFNYENITPIFGELDLEEKVSIIKTPNYSDKVLIPKYSHEFPLLLLLEIECNSDGDCSFFVIRSTGWDKRIKAPINTWKKIYLVFEVGNDEMAKFGYNKSEGVSVKIRSIKARVIS